MIEKKLSIARKELSREFKDGKETVVNERIDFVFDENIIFSLDIIYQDDYEMAYHAGVGYDFNSDIHYLDVDKVLNDLSDRMCDDGCNYDSEKKIIKYLKQFEGYSIWLGE